MALFFEFVVQEWILVGALLVLLSMLFLYESRKGGAAISSNRLTALVNQEKGVVVDVRDSKEFRTGHIVDALNIPHTKLSSRIGELENHKEQPIILVCKVGQHSGAASRLLKEKGFEHVYRLSGGITEWQSSKLPLVRS